MKVSHIFILCVCSAIPAIVNLAQAQVDISDEKLAEAVKTENIEFISQWIEDGGDVNYEFKRLGTLFQYSVNQRAKLVTSLLLDKGVNVNGVTRSNSIPPLSISLSDESGDTYQVLLDHGADPNLPDQFGDTPIFYALRNSNRDTIIPILLNKGADLNHVNNQGATPLLSAFVIKNTSILQSLTNNGANIDVELLADNNKSACGHCHGSPGPGLSLLEFGPHLAGQHEDYLLKQMNDFHSGARKHKFMNEPSRVLIEPLARQLAIYYAALPRAVNPTNASEETLQAGERIYTSRCSICHGEDGVNTQTKLTPVVAGLYATYTRNQLSNYKDGKRTNDEDGVMRHIVTDLSDIEIEAVSEYMQDL